MFAGGRGGAVGEKKVVRISLINKIDVIVHSNNNMQRQFSRRIIQRAATAMG